METTKRPWPLVITIVLLLAVVIAAPIVFGKERVVDVRPVQPAGEIGTGLPLHLYLPLADPPVMGGGR